MNQKPFLWATLLSVIACWFLGCTSQSPLAAGPTDESVIGYVYDTDSSPAPGTIVRVYRDKRDPLDKNNTPDLVDTTDAQGRYELSGLLPSDTVEIVGQGADPRKRFLAEGVTPSQTPRADSLFVPDSVALRLWIRASDDPSDTMAVIDSVAICINGSCLPGDGAVYEALNGLPDRPLLFIFEMVSPEPAVLNRDVYPRRSVLDLVGYYNDRVDGDAYDYETLSWDPVPGLTRPVYCLAVSEEARRILVSQCFLTGAADDTLRIFGLDGVAAAQPSNSIPAGPVAVSGDTIFVLDSSEIKLYSFDGVLRGRIREHLVGVGYSPYGLSAGENGDLFVSMFRYTLADNALTITDLFSRRFSRGGKFLNDLPSFSYSEGSSFSVVAADTRRNRVYQVMPQDGRVAVMTLEGALIDTLEKSLGTHALAVSPEGDLYTSGLAVVARYDTLGNKNLSLPVPFLAISIAVDAKGTIFLSADNRVYVIRERGDTTPVPGRRIGD